MPRNCLYAAVKQVPNAKESCARPAVDDATCKFTSDPQLLFQHPYPATKIMFMPDREGAQPDLLATTGTLLGSGAASECTLS